MPCGKQKNKFIELRKMLKLIINYIYMKNSDFIIKIAISLIYT